MMKTHTQTTEPAVKILGHINGRVINLLFDLGNNKILSGTGLLQHDMRECQGTVDGPLVGPGERDSGTWSIQAVQAPFLV